MKRFSTFGSCWLLGAIVFSIVGGVFAPKRANAQDRKSGTNENVVRKLLNDKRYPFEKLLSADPGAIANAEQIFRLTNDANLRQRLASILISRGVKDFVYFNYLTNAAKKELATPIPWPYDANIVLNDTEMRVVRLFEELRNQATVRQLVELPENNPSLSQDAVLDTIRELQKKGYVRQPNEYPKDIYQLLLVIHEPPPGAKNRRVEVDAFTPEFIKWVDRHPEKAWGDWYREAVYPQPDTWYYLAAAGDPRAFDLLMEGLHSQNVMIAGLAAKGLAKLQDVRAIDEIISVARRNPFGSGSFIAQSLLYFSDPKAQSAANELITDKWSLNIERKEAQKRGAKGLFPW